MKIYWFLFIACILFSCKDQFSSFVQIPQDYAAHQPVELRLSLPLEMAGDPIIRIPGQTMATPLQRTEENTWIFITPRALTKGTKLQLNQGEHSNTSPCVITKTEEFISAKIGDREILRYAISTQYPADSLASYYKRSGFIHPLKTLGGTILTADFPRGHVHQHGIFHAWTRSHIRDSIIDFWNQQAQLGDIRHESVLGIENGPVYSSFTVLLEYLAYFKGDTIVVSEETWDIRIFPLPDHFLVDWHLQQRCLGPDSILIDEYHYGGAAFRGAEAWNLEEGAYDSLVYITTSEGKSHLDGNHTQPEWVVMHGVTDEGYGGIAMFQDPDNYRYPQPIRIHPTMPYFCFAPMVQGSFILHPNDIYEAKFRFMVFDGQPDLKALHNINTNLKNKPNLSR